VKILIASDSYKGSLSSLEVGKIIKETWKQFFIDATMDIVPIADGGEGTVEAFYYALGGELTSVIVKGPLNKACEASYCRIDDLAVIEMAAASGINLVEKSMQDPLNATSYGTGMLIKDAVLKGATRVLIGIGGSATNDAGLGMLEALGVKFYSEHGLLEMIRPRDFMNVTHFDAKELKMFLSSVEITVMCDVDNPLLGTRGATAVYGPQKGVTDNLKDELEASLAHVGLLFDAFAGYNVCEQPGSGAAGGMGAALLGVVGASMKSGISAIIEEIHLEERLAGVDLVITGEGQVDRQTLHGKVPSGIIEACKKHHVPVLILGGAVTSDALELYDKGADAIFSTVLHPMSSESAVLGAQKHLREAVIHLCHLFSLGHGLLKEE